MRFEDYMINETAARFPYDLGLELIKKNCKGIIREYRSGRNVMFRNDHKNKVNTMKLHPVRKNRRPVDTPPKVHKVIDQWFEENVGFRARTEALFAWLTPVEFFVRKARINPSTKYMVFPYDPYKYAYSLDVPDFYPDLYVKVIDQIFTDPTLRPTLEDEESDEVIEAVKEKLNAAKYETKGAMKKTGLHPIGNEVMIHTKRAMLVSAFQVRAINGDLRLGMPLLEQIPEFE